MEVCVAKGAYGKTITNICIVTILLPDSHVLHVRDYAVKINFLENVVTLLYPLNSRMKLVWEQQEESVSN